MKDPRHVLKLHLLTEKTTRLKEVANCYAFRVDRNANKVEVREAVEKAFGVKVKCIRTMIIPGKPKRLGRFEGRTPAWKKAIVILKEGEQISQFENL